MANRCVTCRFRAIRRTYSWCFSRHPMVVEDAFGAGDKIAVRWTATMTHSGNHLGMPATGKPVRSTGMTIARIRDKQIVEGWDNWDQAGMLKQIGAYQTPPTGLLKSA
jgi:predicted ester cyclase